MISNMLPAEATHNLLDFFKKLALLVTFDGFFLKLGLVYNPNGPMQEFEVAGDRNSFIDIQKNFS